MEIKVYKEIMEASDQIAQQIRDLLDNFRIFAINLISSPGSGKTTLLERLIPVLEESGIKIGVIEGDLATSNDAERISRLNIPVAQINTGSGCHLGAEMVHQALKGFPLAKINLLIIENVGNLVCPTGFYLGENIKIGMMSVPEGDDKPVKYPLLLNVSEAIILNKIDLIPYTNFNKDNFINYCKRINSKVKIFETCATTGEGITEFVDWLILKSKT
ncbi:MAG: hydrogenase nickel incorporation protein HypB [Candidatus Hydrogenedentota bacterium]